MRQNGSGKHGVLSRIVVAGNGNGIDAEIEIGCGDGRVSDWTKRRAIFCHRRFQSLIARGIIHLDVKQIVRRYLQQREAETGITIIARNDRCGEGRLRFRGKERNNGARTDPRSGVVNVRMEMENGSRRVSIFHFAFSVLH